MSQHMRKPVMVQVCSVSGVIPASSWAMISRSLSTGFRYQRFDRLVFDGNIEIPFVLPKGAPVLSVQPVLRHRAHWREVLRGIWRDGDSGDLYPADWG